MASQGRQISQTILVSSGKQATARLKQADALIMEREAKILAKLADGAIGTARVVDETVVNAKNIFPKLTPDPALVFVEGAAKQPATNTYFLKIGGKFYMDYKAKEKAELDEIQWDLANYIYNNYRLYTVDEEKFDGLVKEYHNGNITTTEYLEKSIETRIHEEINRIQFIDFKKGPMGGLEVYFILNEIYIDETTLDTKSFETGEWIYRINPYNDRSLDESKPYYLTERE